MEHENITIESSIDGFPISALILSAGKERAAGISADKSEETAGKLRGIVQIVHGMAEHKERYTDFMEFLAVRGYVCVIHDNRGHGKSVRDKSDLGYFYGDGFKCLLQDVSDVAQHVRKIYPDIPRYLLGHSMGSLIVRAYAKRHDDELAGLIVVGSPSKHTGQRLGLFLTKIIGGITGERRVSPFIEKIAGPKPKDPKASSKYAWICSDENIVKEFEKDELCGFAFTINGYENLMKLLIDVYDKSGWQVKNPDLPVHFASGKEDVCLINEKRFREAVGFMRQVGYRNVSSKLYNGMYHEILNEKGRAHVYEDLAEVIAEMSEAVQHV
ncbi:MAG: alpha/beta hydrolase [Firmicutes bacterium]|nr:alpha/beta hydrolase [Bacillota bacterium]